MPLTSPGRNATRGTPPTPLVNLLVTEAGVTEAGVTEAGAGVGFLLARRLCWSAPSGR